MNFRPVAAALGFTVALLATSFAANAADIARPVVVAPVYPFDGFYLGGHIGWGNAHRDGCTSIFSGVSTDHGFADCGDPFSTFTYDQDGGLIGAQMGVNRTFNYWGHGWVIGGEVSADVTGMHGNLEDQFPGYSGTGQWNWLALGLAKLGWTWNWGSGHGNAWMIYIDGGVGLGSFSYNAAACNFTANSGGGAGGVGVEVATAYNNSWFLDWQHINLGHRDSHCDDPIGADGFDTAINAHSDIDLVRFGFNHHFR